MAGDDGFSASELRARYHAGGSAKDSELSSSQLRARYAVETNSFRKGGNLALVYGLVLIGIIAAYLLKMWSGK
jgi:hypothetical protein